MVANMSDCMTRKGISDEFAIFYQIGPKLTFRSQQLISRSKKTAAAEEDTPYLKSKVRQGFCERGIDLITLSNAATYTL